MPTVDEALAASEAEGTVEIFQVDKDLRTVAVPDGVTNIGVESDDSVRVIHFRMPRYYCGFDLSTFNIRINYENAEGDKDARTISSSTVSTDSVEFAWTVGRKAFVAKGDMKFNVCLRLYDTDGVTIKQEYNTTPTTMQVLEGLEFDGESEAIVQLDLVNQLIDEYEERISEAVTSANEAADAANAVVSDIEQAKTDAQTAVTNANNAVSSANSAATAATSAAQAANTAATDANNAASSANSAATTATNAASAANQAKEDANTAEAARVSAENARVSAENARVSAETSRASAETSRVSAEEARASAETARVSESSDAVSAANSATTSANAAAESANAAAARANAAADGTLGVETVDDATAVAEIKTLTAQWFDGWTPTVNTTSEPVAEPVTIETVDDTVALAAIDAIFAS